MNVRLSLGMMMIAEGVETSDQAEFLQNDGCSEMQGYYFYKPMPVEDFEKISGDAEALKKSNEKEK